MPKRTRIEVPAALYDKSSAARAGCSGRCSTWRRWCSGKMRASRSCRRAPSRRGRSCSPTRRTSTRLSPGALRENVVLHGVSAGSLPSGTVLRVGSEVMLRLTFACEPCGHIVDSLAEGEARRQPGESAAREAWRPRYGRARRQPDGRGARKVAPTTRAQRPGGGLNGRHWHGWRPLWICAGVASIPQSVGSRRRGGASRAPNDRLARRLA